MEDGELDSVESIISIDSDMLIDDSTNANKTSCRDNVAKEGNNNLKQEEEKSTPAVYHQMSEDSEYSDISITPSILDSEQLSQPQEVENTIEELKPRLHYTNLKAGMDKVDKAEIERKIFEISK